MNPLIELEGLGENFGLKDLGTLLLSFKHETASTLTSLNTAFNQFRLELQGEMKLVRDEMVEQKNSLDHAWAELEALQAEMLEQKAEIKILKTDANNLERNVESEKQKRLHLDFYSQRENLRLIGENIHSIFPTRRTFKVCLLSFYPKLSVSSMSRKSQHVKCFP